MASFFTEAALVAQNSFYQSLARRGADRLSRGRPPPVRFLCTLKKEREAFYYFALLLSKQTGTHTHGPFWGFFLLLVPLTLDRVHMGDFLILSFNECSQRKV